MKRSNPIAYAWTILVCVSSATYPFQIHAHDKDIVHGKSLSTDCNIGLDENFFTPGYAEIRGKIEDYDPETGIKNFLVYFSDNLIGRTEPISVTIAEDGSFFTWIPLTTPGYAKFTTDNLYFDFFLAQGQTLDVAFNWADVREYCQKRRNSEPVSESPFRFDNDLSRINNQLVSYPEKLYYGVYTMAHDLTPSDAIKQLSSDYGVKMQEAAQYAAAKDLDPATSKLLLANVKSKFLFDVFEYARTREGLERTDTLAPSLGEPLTLKYFDAVKDLLADHDQWVMASKHFGGIANMMANSPLIPLLGYEDHFLFDYGVNALPYLKSLGAILTPQEEEVNEWLGEGGRKSCTLKQLYKAKDATITAAERNGLTGQLNEFNKRQRDEGKMQGSGILTSDAASNIGNLSKAVKEYIGVNTLPLLWQVVLSEALRSRFMLNANNYNDKDQLLEVVEDVKKTEAISNPAVMEALGNFYRRSYAQKSFDIPDDQRGKVIRNLIAPYSDKMLLLDFWDMSCGPCLHAIQTSVKAREKNRNHPDFKMLFISDDSGSEKRYEELVMKYLEGETSYRISASDFHLLRDLFGFSGIPRYVLISRDGRVLDSDFKFYSMKRTLKDEYDIELEGDVLDELIEQ